MVAFPFPDTGCPVPDVYIYYVPDMINVWILFLHLSTPLDVSARGHSLLNRLDSTERNSFISEIYILNLV